MKRNRFFDGKNLHSRFSPLEFPSIIGCAWYQLVQHYKKSADEISLPVIFVFMN